MLDYSLVSGDYGICIVFILWSGNSEAKHHLFTWYNFPGTSSTNKYKQAQTSTNKAIIQHVIGSEYWQISLSVHHYSKDTGIKATQMLGGNMMAKRQVICGDMKWYGRGSMW